MERQHYYNKLIKGYTKKQLADILALTLCLLDHDATNNAEGIFADGWRCGRRSLRELIDSEIDAAIKYAAV